MARMWTRFVPRSPGMGRTRVWPVVLALVMGLPASLHAHVGLESAKPGAGDTLTTVPTEIRLTFTERIEISVAHVALTGPDGAVALLPLRLHEDSARVLIAGIDGDVMAGAYTVSWRILGSDGHPVEGDYEFTLLPGADGPARPSSADGPEGPPAPGQEPPPEEHHVERDEAGFGVQSPTYVVIRWITFLSLLVVLGAVAYATIVVPLVGWKTGAPSAPLELYGARSAARIGVLGALVGAAATLGRLVAQSIAVHGSSRAFDLALVGSLVSRTLWGWGWVVQAVATVVAVIGLYRASRRRRGGWFVAAVGALVLAFTPALSGHAVASGLVPLAADGLHVVGAGGWIGSLLIVLMAGVPAVLSRDGERRASLGTLVEAFSVTALLFAALLTVTGLVSAWTHLPSVPALWESAYGRVLLVKVGVLTLVFATGAYNFLRVRPELARDEGAPEGARRLRRSAGIELAVAVAVLLVTAVLVATPTPDEATVAPAAAVSQQNGGEMVR